MKISNPKDKIFTTLLIVALVGVMFAFSLPCPFRALLHIYCPGCGMTRAYPAALRRLQQQIEEETL